MKVRLKRIRVGRSMRNGMYRQVEYSKHLLTDWIEVSNLSTLRNLEGAVDEINQRRVRNSQKDDYYTLEVDNTGGIDTLDELKEHLKDIDKNMRGYRPLRSL